MDDKTQFQKDSALLQILSPTQRTPIGAHQQQREDATADNDRNACAFNGERILDMVAHETVNTRKTKEHSRKRESKYLASIEEQTLRIAAGKLHKNKGCNLYD